MITKIVSFQAVTLFGTGYHANTVPLLSFQLSLNSFDSAHSVLQHERFGFLSLSLFAHSKP